MLSTFKVVTHTLSASLDDLGTHIRHSDHTEALVVTPHISKTLNMLSFQSLHLPFGF